ncbi:FAD binding domain-containing protein [Xylaria intraflava]|nr:FAD binding domain-containing protein [Xylaria intraflava]
MSPMDNQTEMPANGFATPKEPTNSKRPFRIVIVGGGVAGLALSHALTRVHIDHVVLEKGVVAPDWGASISLWGNGSRILSQIGCLEALEAAALPLKMLHVRGPSGKAYNQGAYFEMMRDRSGYESLTMERREFLRIIYREHPEKNHIREHARVVDIVDGPEDITVKLEDGSTEVGDLVVGCDGVHSIVRELMWRNANATIPNYIRAEEKQSLITSYKSLVGVAKAIPGLGIRDMHWVTHHKLSFLILTQPDKIYFFVNWKLPQQTRWPTKSKWSTDAADAAAASVLDLPISDSAVFGELWKNKLRAHLIGLEEGTFEHWHFGRVALVGDSVHKVTPNFALGANCALESSAALLNQVHRLLSETEPDSKPSKAAISEALERYQQVREPRQRDAASASALLTRLQAWDGPLNYLIMRYVWPLTGQGVYADLLAELCAGAPRFEFLPMVYTRPATYKWRDDPNHAATPYANSAITRHAAPALDLTSVELIVVLACMVFSCLL